MAAVATLLIAAAALSAILTNSPSPRLPGSRQAVSAGYTITARIIATLTDPHSTGVQTVQFSPDGKTLVTADADGGVYLWNTATHSRTTLIGVGGPGNSATFSPDRGTLAIGYTTNGVTHLWNDTRGGYILTVTDPQSQGSQPAVFSPDGTMMATADYNGSTYLWDIATRSRVGVLTDPHSNSVYWAAVSPDGRMLATADGNGSTYLWALTVHKTR